MTNSTITRIAVLALLMGGLSACKSSETVSDQSDAPDSENTTEQTAEANNSDTDENLEELYWQRQEEAKMNFSEDDVKFMTGMIAHHAQALIMSDLAPKNDASPAIQRLASRIINAQKDEINSMQRWLRDRGQPVPEVHIEGLQLMIHGLGDHHAKMDHTNMAGMLSPTQLENLSEARGEEFDRLFLEYMIAHHQGAVTMVTKLFNSDGAVQDEAAFKLASDIQVDQRTEIDRMELMLEDITASN